MAKDPLKYFRIEAKELLEGLSRGALDLDGGAAAKEAVPRLLRLAHTLKGASRVVKQAAIADLAHALEDALAPHRDAAGPVPRPVVAEALKLVDALAARVTSLEAVPASAPSPSPAPAPVSAAPAPSPAPAPTPSPSPATTPAPAARAPAPETFETVRVEISEVEGLLAGISEAAVQVAALRERARELRDLRRSADQLVLALRSVPGGARPLAEDVADSLGRVGRALAAGLDRAERELRDDRDRADRLRLVRTGSIFGPLERAVRDAAESLGKRVELEATGGETRIDAHVLTALRTALLHVVRNAVDHGIEPEAERARAGKPPVGRIKLHFERRGGGRVAFRCADDGRGIDVEAVRRKAARRGLVTPQDAAGLTLEQACGLVFEGLTTREEAGAVSGRGVGLDVVRETAVRLKGSASATSEPGRGTAIEIVVPVSLSSLPVLAVGAAGDVLSVPLDAVERTLRVASGEVLRDGGRATVLVDREPVPYAPLERALGRAPAAPAPADGDAGTAVLVRAGDRRAVVGVERLHGVEDVVIRPLPAVVGPLALVVGASFDAEGTPRLLLDPGALVETVRAGGAAALLARPSPGGTWGGDGAGEGPRPILVIDDSLTTRILEQSILESAGYRVELATSAEEGLLKAQAGRYGLYIVDVEMPGMNGFEFVTRTRADPTLGAVPAIMVSSLAAPEDRRRAAEAGARAYMVKGEFDQGRFLATVGELLRSGEVGGGTGGAG